MITAKQIKGRFEKAKSRRQQWDDLFATAYDYSCPHRETFYYHAEGEQKNAEIFDSTAVDGLQRFAGRIQSALIPPWQQWGDLKAGSEIPEEEKQDLNQQLQHATDILFTHFNHSNLYNQAHEAFIDLGIGTGAMLFNENPEPGGSLFLFEATALANLYLEEGPNGSVQNVYRVLKPLAGNIEQTWPDIKLDDELAKVVKDSPEKKVDLIEATIYDPKKKQFEYVLVYKERKVLERSFKVSPWIIFRWSVAPNETYGRGPILQVLPDILTANKAVEFKLRAGALAVSGTYMGRDDGVLNPYNLNITPNTVIPVMSNDSSNPSLARLDTGADFQVGELMISDLRMQIKRVLLDDALPPVEGMPHTATEIQIRHAEQLQAAGANFGRLQTEFLTALVNRAVDILAKNGVLPEFTVDGKQITLQFESPLARAQRNDELVSLQQLNQLITMEGPEMKGIWFKSDKYPSRVAELLGHPDMINTPEEAEMQKEKLAQMMAAAQQMQQPGGEGGQPA